MTWNHRIVRRHHLNEVTGEKFESLGMHEVFYNKDGEPWSCTQDPVEVDSCWFTETDEERLDELRQTLDWMRAALDKPILDIETDFTAQGSMAEEEDLIDLEDLEDF